MSIPIQLELFPPATPPSQRSLPQPTLLAPDQLWPTLAPVQQQALRQAYLHICQRLLTALTPAILNQEATNE